MRKFEKQLKQDHTIDNIVPEIKLWQARCNNFHLKFKEIDESVSNKIRKEQKGQ